MKLTDISSNGFEGCPPIRMNQLDPGLNVVFGGNQHHVASLRRFITSILYGHASRVRQVDPGWPDGFVTVDTDNGRYQLSRETASYQDDLRISGLSSNDDLAFPRKSLSSLDRETYELMFTTQAGETRGTLEALLGAIRLHFDTERPWLFGNGFTHDLDDWKLLAEERRRQMDQLCDEINRLESERDRLTQQIQQEIHQVDHGDVERQLYSVRQELGRLRSKMTADVGESESLQHEIRDLTERISELKLDSREYAAIDEADWMKAAYRTLDEIDTQIGQWQQLQRGIQDQRVRLRDEMSVFTDLQIENEEHPFHSVRELIAALDQKLNRTETLAANWNRINDPAEDARRLTQFCSEMRDDLESLCEELSRKYKHVRHKAAVAELKQLRRCFRDMEQNIELLLKRRDKTIDSIRQLDPAGASAVSRAENDFLQLADREGYYHARERFVTERPALRRRTIEATDPRDEILRREELIRRHKDVESELERSRQRMDELANREQRLVGDLALSRSSGLERLKSHHANIERQLLGKRNDHQRLTALIEDDKKRLQHFPIHSLFQSASKWLNELSSGVWTEIQSDALGSLAVANRHGDEYTLSTLRDEDLDEVHLAIVMAVVGRLGSAGLELPMVVQHDRDNDSNPQVTMRTMAKFASEGHQVIWVTSNRRLLEEAKIDGHRTFELPDTSVTQPTAYPDLTELPRSAYDEFYSQEFDDFHARYYPLRYSHLDPTPIVTTSDPVESLHLPTSEIIEEGTPIRSVDLVESIYLNSLAACGIDTIDDLLEIDVEKMDAELTSRGFKEEQVARWQQQACLLVCIPHLDTVDARILVASSIDDPYELMQLDESQIINRIEEFFHTPAGRRCSVSVSRYDRRRIALWTNYLKRNSTWQDRYRPGIWNDGRRRKTNSSTQNGASRGSSTRQAIDSRRNGEPQSADPRPTKSNRKKSSGAKYRFYLRKNDAIVDAPSIGPKSAEYFENAGVHSIDDFLNVSPEDIAKKINQRRMSAKSIELWQRQVRLMCEVPNLRGHDAQLLVGIGIDDPDELAAMEPADLLKQVGPFAKSKDGQRILRNSTPPDMEEVTEWIDSARNGRGLQAA